DAGELAGAEVDDLVAAGHLDVRLVVATPAVAVHVDAGRRAEAGRPARQVRGRRTTGAVGGDVDGAHLPHLVVRRAVVRVGQRAVLVEGARVELVVLTALRVGGGGDAEEVVVDGPAQPDAAGEDGVDATPLRDFVVGVAAVEEQVALVVEAGADVVDVEVLRGRPE